MGIEKHAKKLDVKNAIITSIVASLGFITALFWRDAIRGTMDLLIPEGEGLLYMYLVALLATLIVIVAVYMLLRIQETDFGKKEKVKKGK